MTKISGEVLEIGIDWITGIGKSPIAQESMQNWAASLLSNQHALGFDTKPWRFVGYEGFRCGPVQAGSRSDSTCIRLSSTAAQEHWSKLYAMCESVTRVDVMVTLRIPSGASKALARAHRQALRHSARSPRGPSVTLIRGNDGSGTLYLGKRTSDAFARVYLKGLESGLDHYHETLRFEVEFKGATCHPVLRRVARERPQIIAMAGLVSGFLGERGIDLSLPTVDRLLISIPRSRTDDARRLEWLRTQVRPSVQLLIEHGCYDDVLIALGLGSLPSVAVEASPFLQPFSMRSEDYG